MKLTLSLLLIITLVACQNQVVFEGDKSKQKKEIVKFSRHIEKVVVFHEAEHFIKHFDPAYTKEQLEGNLKGNSEQFLNEIFCGKNEAAEFKCLKFDQIKTMDLVEIIDMKEDRYTLKYKLSDEEGQSVTAEIFIKKNETSFYLYSAVG